MSEPTITAMAVHISDGSNLPVTRIVIHATSPEKVPYPNASAPGTARGTADYFQDEASGGSAHYVEDIAGEEHCVPEMAIAWHAPPNAGSIGLEVCGLSSYTREQWLSPQVYPAVLRTAERTRDVAARHVVPLVRLTVADLRAGRGGICGHVDVSLAFKQSDHTDPGPEFPWDHFMAAVLNALPAPDGAKQPQEDDDMPLAITLTDPDTKGTWTCRVADGAVFADAGAPFLGGYNGHPDWGPKEPIAGFALWKDDAGKWGYKFITAGADAFHFYRMPRDGRYAA